MLDSIGETAAVGQRLECHYCGYKRTVPRNCPECDSEHLYFLGAGSQQGEEKLLELFPNARIGRMDRDTVRGRADIEAILARLHSGDINLLVGTQMIAKGHDIHGVTLVGVVGCDHALSLPDFRAAERVFQLLTQVSGRAGRGVLPGRVLVQTYYPEHYAVRTAAAHDFHAFAAQELKYRRWMHYPPNTVLANIVLHSERLEEAAGWSRALARRFHSINAENEADATLAGERDGSLSSPQSWGGPSTDFSGPATSAPGTRFIQDSALIHHAVHLTNEEKPMPGHAPPARQKRSANLLEGIRVLGPAPTPLSRIKRNYRFHFLLKSQSRQRLGQLLRALLAHAEDQHIPRRNLTIDVDPVHLL